MRALAKPRKQSSTVKSYEHRHGDASWKGSSAVAVTELDDWGAVEALVVVAIESRSYCRNPRSASSGVRSKYSNCHADIRYVALARFA